MNFLAIMLIALSTCMKATTVDRFIVRTSTYFWQHEHFQILSNLSCTGGSSGVSFIWRDGVATLNPTDFSVVSFLPQELERFSACIGHSSVFKGVHLDRLSSLILAGHGAPIAEDESCASAENEVREFFDSIGPDQNETHLSEVSWVSGNTITSQRSFTVSTSSLKTLLGHDGKPNSGKGKKDNSFVPKTVTIGVDSQLRGQNVKVAIFDTGLINDHPDFKHVHERTDWTTDMDLKDVIGHGSFVSSVIAGINEKCPGIAPEAELLIFKVFTKDQMSYTSWFLDAFNYALYKQVDVLNFSIGGPDHKDQPFTDKIHELAANGVIIVSAIGNDGLWGSNNNPADMMDVVGVGGYDNSFDVNDVHAQVEKELLRGQDGFISGQDEEDSKTSAKPKKKGKTLHPIQQSGKELLGGVSLFSSRGMTTFDLPMGVGLVKPDILAPSVGLLGSSMAAPFTCKKLSGTSVASPIVAGAVATILSSTSDGHSLVRAVMKKRDFRNVASVKQILIQSATPLRGVSLFEAGSGVLDLGEAIEVATSFVPHVSIYPDFVSNFQENCPEMWPLCGQKIFYKSTPFLFNFTVLNSVSVRSKIVSFQWEEKAHVRKTKELLLFDSGVVDVGADANGKMTISGEFLDIKLDFSQSLFPWSGFVAVSASVTQQHRHFVGYVTGMLRIFVQLQPPFSSFGDHSVPHLETATVEVEIGVVPAVPRAKRILFDAYHNMQYPSPYVPRDNLAEKRYMLDWLGDHPYTNYRTLFNLLSRGGYSVELLRAPWTCFDASQYATLLVVDPEDEFTKAEMDKVEADVRDSQLSVVIVADWHDAEQLEQLHFFDDNTRSEWYPVIGGSNIPSINTFLNRFGGQFGLQTFAGTHLIEEKPVYFHSGNTIAQWPSGGMVIKSGANALKLVGKGNLRASTSADQIVVGGMTVSKQTTSADGKEVVGDNSVHAGRVVAYGDSSCFDETGVSHGHGKDGDAGTFNAEGCEFLYHAMLRYVTTGHFMVDRDAYLPPNTEFVKEDFVDDSLLHPYKGYDSTFLQRLEKEESKRAVEFKRYSKSTHHDRGDCARCICDELF